MYICYGLPAHSADPYDHAISLATYSDTPVASLFHGLYHMTLVLCVSCLHVSCPVMSLSSHVVVGAPCVRHEVYFFREPARPKPSCFPPHISPVNLLSFPSST